MVASFSIIWIIMMVCMVIAVKNTITGGTKGKKNEKQPPQVTQKSTVYVPKPRSFAAMPKQTSAAPNVERNCNAEDGHHYENMVSAHKQRMASAVPNVPSKTMHVQPKKSGNRKPAKQLYIGDMVPRGMRVIKCDYCAADNLVPINAGNEYKCYFCHYDI